MLVTMLPDNMVVRLLLVLMVLYGACVTAYQVVSGKCEPLTKASFCHGLSYNTTILPNIFGHRYQRQAIMHAKQFTPLVAIKCSENVALFFCSSYFPVCNALERPIPPCRSLCHRVKNDCEPIMKIFGFDWPKKLKCDTLPVASDRQLCVAPATPQASVSTTSNKVLPNKVTKLSLKRRQKLCYESKDRKSKRCCRHGIKAAKLNYTECSLDVDITRNMSERERRFLEKRQKGCAPKSFDTTSSPKLCYTSCCEHYLGKQARKIRKRMKNQL